MHPDGTARRHGPQGELDGEHVVPGFHCRVADLFPPEQGPESGAP